MDWFKAIILGVIQGLTEFFPVSSSAHLKIVKYLFGVEGDTVLFDLFCHLGTFIALVVYFRGAIFDMLTTHRRRLIPFIVALAPLIPFYFLLKPFRETLSQPELLGYCMIGTALTLFGSSLLIRKGNQPMSNRSALWVGTMQGFALVPGISRSATTIGAALLRKVGISQAVEFSFLLSLPAIAGGTFLELLKLRSSETPHTFSLTHCTIGFFSSAIIGFAMVKVAIPLLQKGVLRPFAWYCLIAGVLVCIVL